MSAHRQIWRELAVASGWLGRRPRFFIAGIAALAITGATGLSLAQPMSDQQIRCMQLQQELASNQGGGADDLQNIEQQIAQNQRVYDGTKAAMEDAGCYESFFIFGRGLVRTPKCLKMNDRLEDAGRQLSQLQEQRDAIRGGGSDRRRQADIQDALARNGCAGVAPPRRSSGGGGILDWFGREQVEPDQGEQQGPPISRSIDPNGRYRSICVRLCDGFFYPISYSTGAGHLNQDAQQCQSNCAAPAELYVYRNPGQGPEQAISLNGSAYTDLPVAFRFKKEYVKGCSCKQVEYNPTEIEQANKKAEADTAAKGKNGKKPTATASAQPAAPASPAPATAATGNNVARAPAQSGTAQPPTQLDIDVTGALPAQAPAAGDSSQDQAVAPSASAATPNAAGADANSSSQQSIAVKKSFSPH